MIASIDLTMSSAKVYIEIEGTVEHDGAAFRPVKGEMAIDDIMLTSSGMCQVLDSTYEHTNRFVLISDELYVPEPLYDDT